MGRKAGSETARNWLWQHGLPVEEGGYVPGLGYQSKTVLDSTAAVLKKGPSYEGPNSSSSTAILPPQLGEDL